MDLQHISLGFQVVGAGRDSFIASLKNSKVILDLVDKVTKELLEDEIKLQIEEVMKGKASREEISENIVLFKKGEYMKIHGDLQRIGIRITYDVGW